MKTERVIDAVSKVCGVTMEQMASPCRKRSVVYARILAMVVLRGEGLTYKEIGMLFNRHKSTVFGHESYTFDAIFRQDKDFAYKYRKINDMLKDGKEEVERSESGNMVCPFCGGILCWGGDEMASALSDDYGEGDSAIASNYTCLNCGRFFEVFDPNEEEKQTQYKTYWGR